MFVFTAFPQFKVISLKNDHHGKGRGQYSLQKLFKLFKSSLSVLLSSLHPSSGQRYANKLWKPCVFIKMKRILMTAFCKQTTLLIAITKSVPEDKTPTKTGFFKSSNTTNFVKTLDQTIYTFCYTVISSRFVKYTSTCLCIIGKVGGQIS